MVISYVSQLIVLQKGPKQQHGGYMKVQYILRDYLISMPAAEGVLKLDTLRWRRRCMNACSISFDSDAGSIRQNDPLPGSSCDRGPFKKKGLSERLCRTEFYNHTTLLFHLKLTQYPSYIVSHRSQLSQHGTVKRVLTIQ